MKSYQILAIHQDASSGSPTTCAWTTPASGAGHLACPVSRHFYGTVGPPSRRFHLQYPRRYIVKGRGLDGPHRTDEIRSRPAVVPYLSGPGVRETERETRDHAQSWEPQFSSRAGWHFECRILQETYLVAKNGREPIESIWQRHRPQQRVAI